MRVLEFVEEMVSKVWDWMMEHPKSLEAVVCAGIYYAGTKHVVGYVVKALIGLAR